MRVLLWMIITLLFLGISPFNRLAAASIENPGLIIVDQDFMEATKIAKEQNKLLFIDFYTTWCAPCKQLDKLVFQDDSIKQILGEEFVLLKYDAENDTVFHLSKKHHVSSYPTAIVLNRDGYVVSRKYGFPGEDFQSLSKSVLDFTQESIERNRENQYYKGYSNEIEETKYPKFYNDYVNRTIKKVQPEDFTSFFRGKEDFLKEEDFTPLFYFGRRAPSWVGDIILRDREVYFDLYGKQDVEVMLYFLTSAKFSEAIAEDSEEKYQKAVLFATQALSQGWLDDILPMFELDRLKAQNKWEKVYEIYLNRKENGDLSDGEVNYFCWDVYKNCDEVGVITKCIKWMKALSDRKPTYAYLDTLAFLLYKSGDAEEAKIVALRALEAAKVEGENLESIQALIDKL